MDHNILLKEIEFYGVRGIPLRWLESYLSSRYQCTTYNGVCSEYRLITCGVPQGSVLGPLLFLIYVNDLAQVSNDLYTLMFADDTNMFITGANLMEVTNKLNVELEKVVYWLKINKLSLNVQKTHYMIFHPKGKKPIHDISVCLDNYIISKVTECKFLGVIIDNKLTWKNHV